MAENSEKLFGEFPPSTHDEWVSATVKSLKGKPIDKLTKTSYEDFYIQLIYRANDIEDISHNRTLPGEYPYVRGTSADGYFTQPWLIAQYIDITDPNAFNQALKHDLSHGQTAIIINTNPLPFQNLDDVAVAFADIDLAQYPLLIRADSIAKDLYHELTTNLPEHDVMQLVGCIGYDPLHQLATSGRVSATIFDSMVEYIASANEHAPHLDTIAIHTDIYHSAGANAVQELAIAMATGVTYLSELIERGVDLNLVAQKMRFFLSIGENFFMEIAKLRAVKMMWAQIMREFGGDTKSGKIKLHASTGNRNKTRYDTHVNMLRVTSEAMAGAIGGVDSMTTSPFDVPIGESDEFSRRIARNIQLILQDEVNLTNQSDPAGGSWYIESLTDQLAQSAWDFFQEIEAYGGIIQALEAGIIQEHIRSVADDRHNNVATRKDVLVGTNMYPNLNEAISIKDNAPADSDPHIGVGDTGHVIVITPLQATRLSTPFEELRAKAEAYLQTHGTHPQIFLANFGELHEYKARMDFARGFYEVGGFEVIDNGGYASVDSAIQATIDSGAITVVICSTDDKYTEFVSRFARAIKAQMPDMIVILAGYPKDKIDYYTLAGVDDFIHKRANCYEMNRDLHDRIGISK